MTTCPMQHHEPKPWRPGETDPELVGLCMFDLAAPESHHRHPGDCAVDYPHHPHDVGFLGEEGSEWTHCEGIAS